MVNYICPIFRFATQIFNGPPLQNTLYIPDTNIIHHFNIFSLFIFPIKPPAVRHQFTVYNCRQKFWEGRFSPFFPLPPLAANPVLSKTLCLDA